jgi:hypothetical protein
MMAMTTSNSIRVKARRDETGSMDASPFCQARAGKPASDLRARSAPTVALVHRGGLGPKPG